MAVRTRLYRPFTAPKKAQGGPQAIYGTGQALGSLYAGPPCPPGLRGEGKPAILFSTQAAEADWRRGTVPSTPHPRLQAAPPVASPKAARASRKGAPTISFARPRHAVLGLLPEPRALARRSRPAGTPLFRLVGRAGSARRRFRPSATPPVEGWRGLTKTKAAYCQHQRLTAGRFCPGLRTRERLDISCPTLSPKKTN